MDDLPSVYAGIRTLGSRLAAGEEAEALCDQMGWGLEAIRRRVAGLARPKVLLCLGRMPDSLSGLTSSSGQGFLGELLDIAGGENIFADSPLRYPQVSLESLARRAPEVIIEMRGGERLSEQRRRELVQDWQDLPLVPAVRSGRVHILTDDYLLVPGPRMHLIARRLAMVLHPEAFQ